jgi:hypothetical protein
MSSHSYPAFGHVIKITPENIRLLNLGKAGENFIKLIEAGDITDEDQNLPFVEAFENKYRITPTIDCVNEESDGCDGVERGEFYLVFGDGDKYTKAIRHEWSKLPIQPTEASWTVWG